HFALDLQADEQEEQSHQAVIDPEKQRFGDFQCADLCHHGHFQQAVVQPGQRRVIDDQGKGGSGDQQQTASRLKLEKTFECVAYGQ
nr:hypothetical protein [Tanacetum cinerariifolium]